MFAAAALRPIPRAHGPPTSKSVRSSFLFSPRLVLGAVAVLATGLRPMLSAPSGLSTPPTFDMVELMWEGREVCSLAWGFWWLYYRPFVVIFGVMHV